MGLTRGDLFDPAAHYELSATWRLPFSLLIHSNIIPIPLSALKTNNNLGIMSPELIPELTPELTFSENEEGALAWRPVDQLNLLPMWEGDRYFLPLVFDSDPRIFHGHLPYKDSHPLSWNFTRI